MRRKAMFLRKLSMAKTLTSVFILIVVSVITYYTTILPLLENSIASPIGDSSAFSTAHAPVHSRGKELLQRTLPQNESEYKNGQVWEHGKGPSLESLSNTVQEQLAGLQIDPTLCTGPTLYCGHRGWCGLGCQVQHRMTCVALSYAMKIPLIHEDIAGWAYNKPWKSAFSGPGSNCQQNPETIRVMWLDHGPYLFRVHSMDVPGRFGVETHTTHEVIPFPLKKGFVVPKIIGEQVDKLHEDPFLWWAGQFAKFTMKLTEEQLELVNKAKRSIGLGNSGHAHATVGIQVRRTDKILELKKSRHPVSDYFAKLENLRTEFPDISENDTIFVASDDHTVLPEARSSYPNKSILGFPANETFYTQGKRKNSLNEIIRDVVILSESDFIICGLSSNVCRLLLELMSARHPDATRRLKSVDGHYEYYIQGFSIPNNVIFS